MQAATVIFPHQLFKKNPAVSAGRIVYLVEELLFFKHYHFHKQKLVLHRASMKQYEDYLLQSGFTTVYIEATSNLSDIRRLVEHLAQNNTKEIHYTDVYDDWLRRRLLETAAVAGIAMTEYQTPGFLNTLEETDNFFHNRKHYFQTDFYIWQRKQRNILVDSHYKPAGGKWTFDTDNRKKIPTTETIPAIGFPQANTYVLEAKEYVGKNFPGNPGCIDSPLYSQHGFYPVNFNETEEWLSNFLEQRFAKFGIYEDAMKIDHSYLFHAVLTPMLNIGLLTPTDVITKTMAFAKKENIPLNSLEGFIRQIIGWREFMRILYERESRKQRTLNFWQHDKKIPASFWTGDTGIAPVDIVIKRILETGYCHHIERLMVLGNFMLLCRFNPHEVYRWFMEMFIDSYDWVMVPNIYGMSQFADGGLMTTKPYISGSSYLMKMGNWEKGIWQQIWDGLFWLFIHDNRSFFEQSPRMKMLVNTLDKMTADKRKQHFETATEYLQNLSR